MKKIIIVLHFSMRSSSYGCTWEVAKHYREAIVALGCCLIRLLCFSDALQPSAYIHNSTHTHEP